MTTVKKPAKIVSIWRVNPNSNTTTDELYEYITQKTTEESSEICDDSTESAGKRQSSGK